MKPLIVILFLLTGCWTSTLVDAQTFPQVNGCGSSVGCFSDCGQNSCTFLISWSGNGNMATYTLKKGVGSQSSGWLAIGFSNDSYMGNDDVLGCIFNSGIFTKFTGKNKIHTAPTLYNDDKVSLPNGTLANGVLTCIIERPIQASSSGSVNVSSPLVLLYALGPLGSDSSLSYHTWHTSTPRTVTIASLDDVNTAITSTASPTTPQAGVNKFSQIVGCGTTLGCFSDCQNQQCSYQIAWKQVGTNAEYTWKAYVGSGGNSWIAIGFSSDDKMGDDDVLICFVNSQGSVTVGSGVNGEHSHPESYTDSGVQQTAGSYDNGVLTCTIQRPVSSSTQVPKRVDVSKPWTFLYARGNGGSMGAMQQHSFIAISAQKFMVNETVNVKGPDTLPEYPLVKAHGNLMIAAWIFLASVGIVLARYYKPVWKGLLFSEKIWFQIHRLCMILVFLLTAIGFIIIFVEVDGYSKINESREFLVGHPIIGIIVMILTVLNPIMAMFRCHPGTPKRPIFNWAHWFVGTSAHILGVVNIFFGVLLTKAQVPYYLVYILGAYVAWQLFVEILLELLSFFGRRADKSEMYELSNGSSSKKITTEESGTIILIKRIILVVHVVIVAGFAAALIALLSIGQAELES